MFWRSYERRMYSGRMYSAKKELTHILNEIFSCIDLLFTTQLKLGTQSGIYSPLRSNCYQQIGVCTIQSENLLSSTI